MFNIAKQAADCIFDKVDDDFRIFMTNKRTWCHSSGEIDVGDGCSRRNVLVIILVTVFAILVTNIQYFFYIFRYQHSKYVTKIKILSPKSGNCCMTTLQLFRELTIIFMIQLSADWYSAGLNQKSGSQLGVENELTQIQSPLFLNFNIHCLKLRNMQL